MEYSEELESLEGRNMTAQEKCIIETILADIGLEPLFVGDNDSDSNKTPDRITKVTYKKRIPK